MIFFWSVDIDECYNATNIVCEQLCVNTPGSAYCACQEGYQLTDDMAKCIGKLGYFCHLLKLV